MEKKTLKSHNDLVSHAKLKASHAITKQMGLMEVVELNPDAADLLAEAGMHCLGCMAAHFETLENGCKAHGMSDKEIDALVKKLNKNERTFRESQAGNQQAIRRQNRTL